jgi:hypothetical protein
MAQAAGKPSKTPSAESPPSASLIEKQAGIYWVTGTLIMKTTCLCLPLSEGNLCCLMASKKLFFTFVFT